MQVGACVSLKLASKGFLRGKKTSQNLAFQTFLLKQKRRSATKTFELFLYQFSVGKPSSTIYFLEVGAPVSVKLTIIGFLRGKKKL